MTGRQERLREQARARQRQHEERLARRGVKPPSNDDALAEIARGMRATGEDAAAAQAALVADPDAGHARLVEGHRTNGETPDDREWDPDAGILEKALNDPEWADEHLTAQQRIGLGHVIRDRELEEQVKAEDAANSGSA
jgi:hypothetical protein